MTTNNINTVTLKSTTSEELWEFITKIGVSNIITDVDYPFYYDEKGEEIPLPKFRMIGTELKKFQNNSDIQENKLYLVELDITIIDGDRKNGFSAFIGTKYRKIGR